MLEEAQVQTLARLARIAVEPAELSVLAAQLSRILSLVEAMEAVDTQGVEPLAHPLEPTPRRRPDSVTETDQRAQFAAVAPAMAEGYYLVPRVIE